MKVIELSVNQLLIKSSLASSSYLGQAICGLKKKKNTNLASQSSKVQLEPPKGNFYGI